MNYLLLTWDDCFRTVFWNTNACMYSSGHSLVRNRNIKEKSSEGLQELREEATPVVWVKWVWIQNIPELPPPWDPVLLPSTSSEFWTNLWLHLLTSLLVSVGWLGKGCHGEEESPLPSPVSISLRLVLSKQGISSHFWLNIWGNGTCVT